jgi:Ca2+-binding EF-hand superfamily protein
MNSCKWNLICAKEIEAARAAEEAANKQFDEYEKNKNFVHTRFVKLLRSILEICWNLEQSKNLLCKHKIFNLQDAFRLIDKNGDIEISCDEIIGVFEDHAIDQA